MTCWMTTAPHHSQDDRHREAAAHGQGQRCDNHEQHTHQPLEIAIVSLSHNGSLGARQAHERQTAIQPRRPGDPGAPARRRKDQLRRGACRAPLIIGRAQDAQHGPQLGDRLPARSLNAAQCLARPSRRAAQQRLCRRGLDHHQRDDVSDRVVQLARHARALLGHRQPAACRALALQPRGQRTKLRGPAAMDTNQAACQPRHRERRRGSHELLGGRVRPPQPQPLAERHE